MVGAGKPVGKARGLQIRRVLETTPLASENEMGAQRLSRLSMGPKRPLSGRGWAKVKVPALLGVHRQLVGCWGRGETPEEALRNLEKRFEETRNRMLLEGKTIPRPGTRVALEVSPQEKVESNPELKDDFVRSVLKLGWAWISDQSSLWDFHPNETNQSYFRTISLLYGVYVSDIEFGNIAEILERIASVRQNI